MRNKISVDDSTPRYALWILWAVGALYLVIAALRPTASSWRQAALWVLLASSLTYSGTAGRRDTWRTPRKWLFGGVTIAALVLAFIPFVHHW